MRTMNLKGLICPIIPVTPILHTSLDQIVSVEKKLFHLILSFTIYFIHQSEQGTELDAKARILLLVWSSYGFLA